MASSSRRIIELSEEEIAECGLDQSLHIRRAHNSQQQSWDFEQNETLTDLVVFLEKFKMLLKTFITKAFISYRGFRLYLILTVEYQSFQQPEGPPFYFYLHSPTLTFITESTSEKMISDVLEEIIKKNNNALREKSDLNIVKIHRATIGFSAFEPLRGSGYIPLPKFLELKRAIVNVKNTDNRCFGYAILSALHPQNANRNLPIQYEKYFVQHGLNEIEYPVNLADMEKIEKKLKLKINIFQYYDKEGISRYPVYISNADFETEIDLLYFEGHYAWIKNFSRFIGDLRGRHGVKTFCKRCFGIFTTEAGFQTHQVYCSRGNFNSIIYSFPAPGSVIEFRNVRYMAKCPFVIYADFECLLQANDQPFTKRKGRTSYYSHHVPCAVGLKVVSSISAIPSFQYESFVGLNAAELFLNRLLEIQEQILRILHDDKFLIMTSDDWASFVNATECFVCQLPFPDPSDKVRDHDHYTGKFRGAAHSKCNLMLQKTFKIPIFIHNFRGYDGHIITLATAKFPKIKVSIIGQGYEKYLTLSFGDHLVFKDSYQFLASSLDQLAHNLLRTGRENFKHLESDFADCNGQQKDLLFRKGIFPYEYLDSMERLDEQQLPPLEAFHNKLRQADISEEDYAHAKNVWQEFHCKLVLHYMCLYMKTDVLLLTDVFENFRNVSLLHYRLDPAHYVSSPQLSWDAMLLYTKCVVELISDPEMFKMIDNGIRGGLCMISKRFAKANNPEMVISPELVNNHEIQNNWLNRLVFKISEELSYIVYLDANNLYGWAMKQPLPYGKFRWLLAEEFKLINWISLSKDDQVGYFVECDLSYPDELHELHNEYPLAPDQVNLKYEMLNEYQLRLLSHYSIPRSSLQSRKLIPTLLNRKHYVLHYLNLQFYLEHGMKLQKIHRVIEFRQKAWLASYIVKNQNLRIEAKNDFEKDQAKLYNNACFGKACENQKKRTDIKLVTDPNKCKRLIELPHMIGFRIFTETLSAVELRHIRAKVNKPFYVGFSVLELSKLHMYRFHYDYIKKKFGSSVELLYTDTDSLIYHFRNCNPYETFYKDRDEYFDFSSYPKNHKYYDAKNNKVIGMFKDEANGAQITEFIALRPKMYSYLLSTDHGVLEKHRAKGIQSAASKKIRHAEFLKQLNNPTENRYVNRRIGAKLHEIYSIEINKRGLCAFDDKRILLEDLINTYAYGHCEATAANSQFREEANIQIETATEDELLAIPLGEDIRNTFNQIATKRKIHDLPSEPIGHASKKLRIEPRFTF